MNFAWKAPNLYRSEIIMGIEGRILTVADGTWIWSYQSRDGRVLRQDQAEATKRLKGMGPMDPVTALAAPGMKLSDLFTLEKSSATASSVTLELKPRRGVPNYDRLVLTLDANGVTPRKAESFLLGKPVAEINFTNFRKNAAVDPGLFRFAKNAGSVAETI